MSMLLARSSPQGAGLDPAKLSGAFDLVAGWVEDGVVPGAVALWVAGWVALVLALFAPLD